MYETRDIERPRRRILRNIILFVILMVLLPGCQGAGQEEDDQVIPEGVPTQITEEESHVGLREQGYISVIYGEGCGESNNDGRQHTIEMTDEEVIPSYATQATVFLSGWYMKYLGGEEHEIRRIEVFIKDIQQEEDVLTWKVVGTLRDYSFEDPYQLCYHYTVLAWNEASISAFLDHDEVGNANSTNVADQEFRHEQSALITLPSYMQNPNYTLGNGTAFLPRGYTFRWTHADSVFRRGNADHDLLQIAYNHGHVENYIKPDFPQNELSTISLPTPDRYTDYGYISWETQGIFKDDDDRLSYEFAEAFSSISGGGISIIEQPFTIIPRDNTYEIPTIGGVGIIYKGEGPGPIRTESFLVENIPFRYAVPVLTGWNLAFDREDEQVAEIGVWLHNVRYQKSPEDTVGTLHYRISSVLTDNDNRRTPDHIGEHNIDILGLDLVGPPDLMVEKSVPESPGRLGYCDINAGKLRVIIKNVGESAAPPSLTTVEFNFGGSSYVESAQTPSLGPGASTELFFDVPDGCMAQNCSFKITANSDGIVIEAGGNNIADGGCVG